MSCGWAWAWERCSVFIQIVKLCNPIERFTTTALQNNIYLQLSTCVTCNVLELFVRVKCSLFDEAFRMSHSINENEQHKRKSDYYWLHFHRLYCVPYNLDGTVVGNVPCEREALIRFACLSRWWVRYIFHFASVEIVSFVCWTFCHLCFGNMSIFWILMQITWRKKKKTYKAKHGVVLIMLFVWYTKQCTIESHKFHSTNNLRSMWHKLDSFFSHQLPGDFFSDLTSTSTSYILHPYHHKHIFIQPKR